MREPMRLPGLDSKDGWPKYLIPGDWYISILGSEMELEISDAGPKWVRRSDQHPCQ